MEITPVPATSSAQSGTLSELVPDESVVPAPMHAGALGPPPSGYRLSGPTLAGLATLAGVGALLLGSLALLTSLRSDGEGVEAANLGPVVSLLSRPATTRLVIRGPAGRLVLAIGPGRGAYLVRHRLDTLQATRSYQAWVARPGARRPVSAAVFRGREKVVPLGVPVPERSLVTVTVEPAGGSRRPTAAPVFQARLPG